MAIEILSKLDAKDLGPARLGNIYICFFTKIKKLNYNIENIIPPSSVSFFKTPFQFASKKSWGLHIPPHFHNLLQLLIVVLLVCRSWERFARLAHLQLTLPSSCTSMQFHLFLLLYPKIHTIIIHEVNNSYDTHTLYLSAFSVLNYLCIIWAYISSYARGNNLSY